jgi:uncharacterized BrkB/YihY/UPF0761 family membrane protein
VPGPAAIADARPSRMRRVQGRLRQVPGTRHALTALQRDRRAGGGLLAGALAFRLFAVLLPAALLVAVGLGYAATLDRSAAGDAGEAVGIGGAALESIAQASKLDASSRWVLVATGVFALLLASASAAKAIHATHSLARSGGVERTPSPLPSALMLIAAMVAIAAIWGAVGRARADLGAGGTLVALASVVAFAAVWLAVAVRLPHGDAPWTALLPGAVLVGVGLQVIQLGTVLFIADRVARASETYGPLGTAATILLWLFLISRVIVASAMLNVVLWTRRRDAHTTAA